MRVFLNVTEENIKNGVVGSTTTCAVALALKDRGFTNVSVCAYSAAVTTKDGDRLEADTSPALWTFIRVFDGRVRKLPSGVKASRRTLQPATFRLDFE